MPNELKATKGPYRWIPDGRGYMQYLEGDNQIDVFRLEDTYQGYPECGEELRVDISEENAHLLAASWDLYHALENVMKFVNRPYSFKERVKAFTEARAALAKARGEA